MAKKNVQFTISESSSASASTTLVGSSVKGLEAYDLLTIDAVITGATGGTVDVYLQKRVVKADGSNVWIDYLHLPQIAGGASAAYNVSISFLASLLAVGFGTDGSPGVALAANNCAHGHPGTELRLVTVTGTGVSAAANIAIYITARNNN